MPTTGGGTSRSGASWITVPSAATAQVDLSGSGELIREDIVRLASSPLPERSSWAVSAGGTVIQLAPVLDVTPPVVGIRALTYVG